MTHRFSFGWLAPLGLLFACGVEPLEDTGEEDGIPAEVRDRLAANCGIGGCHAGGGTPPNLTAGGSSAILEASSGGKPYVVLGDVEGSYLADALLGVNGAMLMPPAIVPRTPELEADIAVILGWIAGAQFSNPGSSDDDGDDDDDDDASTTEMTGMTGTSSSESTTEGSDSGDSAFAPVQAIFTANCTVGSACHTLFPPNLTSGQAYDNIVDAPSVAGDTYITPGAPEESLVWGRISGSVGTIMPPASETPLTAEELTTIEDWILAGAPE